MKPTRVLSAVLSTVLALCASSVVRAESFSDLDVSNAATIANAINLGTVQLGQTEGSTSQGVRFHVTQNAQVVWGTSFVHEHYEDNWVTVEDWGMINLPPVEVPQYSWQVVGQDYFPAIYDQDGNEIVAEHWEPHFDWTYTGSIWESPGQSWGVTGTHQENQQIWVPETQIPYSEYRYDAPLIHSTASRSDANWVWDVPDNSGGSRPVMRLWDGGMALAQQDGVINMALTPNSLLFTDTSLGVTNTQAVFRADATTYTLNDVNTGAQSTAEYRPELLRFTRTEPDSAPGQTQIAAKSAAFGGVVEVAGDLKVQGVLRVKPGGDISMGEFTAGTRP